VFSERGPRLEARRTGRLEEAQKIFRVLVEEDPDDVDALFGMAETALSIYRRDADKAAPSAAAEFANGANAVEPLRHLSASRPRYRYSVASRMLARRT
jgi:hypothetical protein